MLNPSVNELVKEGGNAYSLVIASAKRAREIASEAKDNEIILEESPLKLAINDIATGKTYIKSEQND